MTKADELLQEMENTMLEIKRQIAELRATAVKPPEVKPTVSLVAEPRLEPEQKKTWMPTAHQVQIMKNAEAEVLRYMIHKAPYYPRDFFSAEPKWVPYYHIPTKRWAVQSATSAISAPILWHWPKGCWEDAINEIPDDIKKMMGIFEDRDDASI